MATNLAEQISGLSALGSDLGGFFTNIAPGLVSLIIVMGIGGAIVLIIVAVAHLVKHKINI